MPRLALNRAAAVQDPVPRQPLGASDKDLAALEAVSQKSLADKRYWEIVAKANDIFIGGSMRDSIWQTV